METSVTVRTACPAEPAPVPSGAFLGPCGLCGLLSLDIIALGFLGEAARRVPLVVGSAPACTLSNITLPFQGPGPNRGPNRCASFRQASFGPDPNWRARAPEATTASTTRPFPGTEQE